MRCKVLNCSGLIGDSLYMLKPIDQYLEQFPDECAGLCVLPNIGGEIIRAHFGGRLPIYSTQEEALEAHPDVDFMALDAGRALQLALDHYNKHKEQVHISQAFAFMLGVNCDGSVKPPLEWIDKILTEEVEKDPKLVVIAPFSASCTRHAGKVPNKTLDDWKHEYLIRHFRKHGYNVVCGAAPDEYITLVSLPISSYRSGKLVDMLKLYRSAALVLSVDTGQMHIASACGTPTIVLWASEGYIIPPQFILPLWAPKTMYVMVGDINKAQPAELLYSIKELTAKMIAQNML